MTHDDSPPPEQPLESFVLVPKATLDMMKRVCLILAWDEPDLMNAINEIAAATQPKDQS